jgi:hypothetical protein
MIFASTNKLNRLILDNISSAIHLQKQVEDVLNKYEIAILALKKIDDECGPHDSSAWLIASNALEEIENVEKGN